MSYLTNFADTKIVQGIQDGDLEYIESDIFRFEVPPSVVIDRVIGNNDIGLDLAREFFELHLYERGSAILVKSVAVPFSEGYLYIREGAANNTLRLGLTFWTGETNSTELTDEERAETFIEKYLSDVPFGSYDCIINFFSNELGTYDEDEWQIQQISDSRREVILERNPEVAKPFDYIEYQQFAYDSVFAPDFDIFNQRLFQYGETTTQFQRLIADFINRLVGREVALYNSFDGQDRQMIRDAFNHIFTELMQRILEYTESEVNERRYRIVEENFLAWLEPTVYDVVAKHIRKFPEGTNLFVVPLPDEPEDPDTGGGDAPQPGEPPFTPPVSDGGGSGGGTGGVLIPDTRIISTRTRDTSTTDGGSGGGGGGSITDTRLI